MGKIETIQRHCNLMNEDVSCLADVHYEIGNSNPIAIRIRECMNVSEACSQKECKYSTGDKDPFN